MELACRMHHVGIQYHPPEVFVRLFNLRERKFTKKKTRIRHKENVMGKKCSRNISFLHYLFLRSVKETRGEHSLREKATGIHKHKAWRVHVLSTTVGPSPRPSQSIRGRSVPWDGAVPVTLVTGTRAVSRHTGHQRSSLARGQ